MEIWFVAVFLLGQSSAAAERICQNFKFVLDENVIPNHALEGHVFKTSIVEKVTHCHMMCRDDCRCISMNYVHSKQRANCELNDVNKEMKPEALKYKPGASYYDLVREYKTDRGRSFVQGRDRCVNRCCQANPCLQGGTCKEICDPTTVRFNCTCPVDYTGQRCEKKPRSCEDLAKNGATISGIHFLYDSQNNLFPVYCDFDSEADYVWTLIQSFSLANNEMFKDHGFGVDIPIREDGEMIDWNAYRLSLSRMQSIANVSTYLRATCNFPVDGLEYIDCARAKLEGHDLFGQWSGQCRTYVYVNIRGIECQECTAETWQLYAWHISSYTSSTNGCQFDGINGVPWEKNFGRYTSVNSAFRCTANLNSTTQHWIGSKLP